MNCKVMVLLVSLAAGIGLSIYAGNEPSGREIVKMVRDRPDGDSRHSVMRMKLINKRGRSRIRKFESWSMDIGRDTKTILFFKSPPDVSGTGFLTWDYDDPDKEDDRWLYLPAMKKTRRISGNSAKSENFMGSDFTYDDMGNRNIDEDKHKLLKSEKIGGRDCWVVESVPKGGDEVYSKKISWISKNDLIGLKMEFYDNMGGLLKTLTVSDIRKVKNIRTAHKLVMDNYRTRHKTIITIDEIEYDIDIKEKMFTVAKLQRGRVR